MKQQLKLDSLAVYEIKVQGHLEKQWSDWFDGLDILPQVSHDGQVTKLTGTVVDQAALYGLLRKLYDLGMPLLSVNCVRLMQE